MWLLTTPLWLWFATAASLEAHGTLRDPGAEVADAYLAGARFDAIVVAGCRVAPGGIPSGALARRTALAVKLWRAGRAPRIILTGGLGDYPPTEAEVAARLALQMGVPRDALVLEDRSTSTEENARFARDLGAPLGIDSVLVVTDSYHVFRSQRVFGRHFPHAVSAGSVPQSWTRGRGALREAVAVLYYALTRRL